MTILALLAMGFIVYIVFTMTAVTVTRFSTLFGNPVIERMTVVTGLIQVFAVEFVFGIPVMIENRFVPALLLVAVVTGITKSLGMNFPDRVAIYTPLGCIFVLAFEVAGVAVHLLV